MHFRSGVWIWTYNMLCFIWFILGKKVNVSNTVISEIILIWSSFIQLNFTSIAHVLEKCRETFTNVAYQDFQFIKPSSFDFVNVFALKFNGSRQIGQQLFCVLDKTYMWDSSSNLAFSKNLSNEVCLKLYMYSNFGKT